MNDPRRPDRFGPPRSESGQTEPLGPRNPPYPDPAYADQAPYASSYGSYVPQWAPTPNETNPTRQLPPQYWQQDQPPPPPGQMPGAPPPQGPKSPRWLWIAAGAAVLLVIALVVALVIANGSAKQQTAIEPLPPMPAPTTTVPLPTTRTSPPSPSAKPSPTTTTGPSTPTETPTPGAMQTVVYNVSGEGRAISITYMDSGDIVQTEFNVALPWSKEVSLSRSAGRPASVTIVNIGHNVTCSVTVGGVQMRQRTGVGITICDSAGG